MPSPSANAAENHSESLFWRLAYPLLLCVAYPLVRVRLWLRGRKEPAYRERVAERFGKVPDDVPQDVVWFHTVSAGETIAAVPLIERVLHTHPQVKVLVTTMTPTGSGEVRSRLGDRVAHCYAPYDFPWAVRRFVRRVRPHMLVLMETELWPNIVRATAQAGAQVLLVNARLSAGSARGYGRLGSLTRAMLGRISTIACQTATHAQRFRALGAADERVVVCGSVKFDVSLSDAVRSKAGAWRKQWQLSERRVWIAGSTHPGEDEKVLVAAAAIAERWPSACLLLVPRHPVRAPAVVTLAREEGLTAELQSELNGEVPQVLVCDTMGSLLSLYGLAEVAFVGGSWADVGGHNPIEPALWGIPLVMGPVDYNFADVVQAFEEAGALQRVEDARSLQQVVTHLLEKGEKAEKADASAVAGEAARAVIAAHTGATDKLLQLLTGAIAAIRR